MSDERKPSEEFMEGLGLLFRAAKHAAERVDVGKVDKALTQVITEAGRVVSTVGKAVAEEVNRISTSGGDVPGSNAAETAPEARSGGAGVVGSSSEQGTPPAQTGASLTSSSIIVVSPITTPKP